MKTSTSPGPRGAHARPRALQNDKNNNNKQQETAVPTQAPTQSPKTKAPTSKPTMPPTLQATSEPTEASTEAPTIQPTQSRKSPSEQSIFEAVEFVGQVSLVFSLYAPGVDYQGMESALTELMTVLLCSRPLIRLVSSRELINECPFEPPGRRHLWSSHSSAARWLQQQEEDITYLWNTLHVAGGVQTLEDDANAADALHYTLWNFSYPVLEWGDDGQDDLQYYLDQQIGTQRVDKVLPWENAKASIIGQEGLTFVLTSHSFDDPVPRSTAKLLQGLGAFMLIANTVFVILITWLARRQRKTFAKLPQGLVTVEGVESMLQETRQHVSQHLSQHSLRAAPRPASPGELVYPNTSPTLHRKKADEDRLLQEATMAPRLNASPLSPPHHSHGLVYHDSLLATNDAEMEDDDEEGI